MRQAHNRAAGRLWLGLTHVGCGVSSVHMKQRGSVESSAKTGPETGRRLARGDKAPWLFLIHQIPPTPNYLRVKIGRRLQRVGAMAIKNSVYVLPNTDDALEDFQWVAREIVEGAGEASVIEARLVEGLSDLEVEAQFLAAREADYRAILEEAQRLRAELKAARKGSKPVTIGTELGRLRKRLGENVEIDFFGASGREAAEALVAAMEADMETSTQQTVRSVKPAERVSGKTWVTRKGIKVDRIASAWLIRQFIDQEAQFKFVPGQGYAPKPGELRFDMFEAEYTHEGDRCTFEVLLSRFGVDDPALHQLAEVVHDIDLKDAKFGRQEALGLERLLGGLTAANADDEVRLAQGSLFFANLYEYFRRNTT